MNHNSVFTKSAKGVMELTSRSSRLPRDLVKVLKLVDGKSTVKQLAEAAGSDPSQMLSTMEKLEKDGYVKEFAPGVTPAAPITAGQPSPSRPTAPAPPPEDDEGDSLDFTVILKASIIPETPDPQAQAERKAKQEANRNAREEGERRARIEAEQKEKEAAEHKARELAEKRAMLVAEARKHSRKTGEAVASSRSKARNEAAALAEARAEADRHAKRIADLRAQTEAAAKPAAKANLLAQAAAAADAQAGALADAVARARAEASVLAEAIKYAESRREALVAAVDAATDAKLKGEVSAEKDQAESELKELTSAHGEAENAVQSLGKAREQALSESRSLVQAKARARAEAQARTKTLAAALSRLESEAEAFKRAKTASDTAADELDEASARAQDKSKELAQAKARAEAGGLAPDSKVQALTNAESCARAQAAVLTEAIAKAESLVTALGESVARSKGRASAAEEAVTSTDDEAEIARLKEAAGQSNAQVSVLEQELGAARERTRELTQARTLAQELARSFGESARKVREEAERRAREESEQKAREEAERRAREEAERKAGEEARLKAAEETRLQEQVARQAAESVPKEEIAFDFPAMAEPEPQPQPRPEPEAAVVGPEEADDSTFGRLNRTFMSSVLFLDIVKYTTRSVSDQMEQKRVFNDLVSNLLRDIPQRDRVIVDTGDGAAIGFFGDPEDAFSFAIRLRDDLAAAQRTNPNFAVRVGVNLGPVKVVKDMRDQVNLVGDGINDAQRVMSFAQPGQVMVSRTFYEVVVRLSDAYAKNFRYQGGRKDKHGKEHMIYEISSAEGTEVTAMVQAEPKAPAAASGYDTSGLAALGINMGGEIEIPSEADIKKELGPTPEELEEQRKRDAKERRQREAEERKLRETEEARTRAEAEERARREEALQAQAEADRHMWEEAQTRKVVAPPPVPEAREAQAQVPKPVRRRKSINIGKMAGIGLVIVAAAGLGLIHVMPFDFAVPQVQQLASARIGDTVTVGSIHGGLFPSPHLTLRKVSIGKDDELTADTVVVPGLSALMGSAGEVKLIEANNVFARQSALGRLAAWDKGSGAAVLPLQTIRLTNVKIDVKELAVPAFDAELSLGADGKVSKVVLNSVDERISGEIVPKAGTLHIQANAKTWQLPTGPALNFDNLQVKATASPGRLEVDVFDGIMFGGRTRGRGVIDWGRGFTLEGEAEMTNVDAGTLVGAYVNDRPLAGALTMKSSFALRGSELKSLFGAGAGRAQFMVEKGTLNNVDLSKALRSGSGESSRGGQTKFNELTGSLIVNDGRWQFRDLRLAAGILSAAGNVEVSGGQSLAGRVHVEIRSAANPLRGGLSVTGTVKDPVLRP